MRVLIAGSLLVLTAVLLTACSSMAADGQRTASPVETTTEAQPDEPRTIVVVGDSNSTGFSGTLENGLNAGTAWIGMLPQEQFAGRGGWAVDGATTADMAAGAGAVGEADVLVVMGGTNDLATGASFESVAANVRHIVALVDADAVAVAAIAPLDFLSAEAIELNAQLATFAADEGWLFIDPWGDVRSADGAWAAEFRTDGVHTSVDGYQRAADAIATQLEVALR